MKKMCGFFFFVFFFFLIKRNLEVRTWWATRWQQSAPILKVRQESLAHPASKENKSSAI